jgi:hypothetical protein
VSPHLLVLVCCPLPTISNTQLLSPNMNLDGHQATLATQLALSALAATVKVSKLAMS